MRPTRVFVGLGSNLGNRRATVLAAWRELQELFFGAPELSPIYESEPQYDREQPRFLNAVAAGRTRLGPFELLDELLAIERRLGRQRDQERPKGPRSIDLDLLLYRDWLVCHPRLVLPHPGITERLFVLQPLIDLDPELTDPQCGRVYARYLSETGEKGIYPING